MYKHPKHNPNKVVRRRIPWLEVFPQDEGSGHFEDDGDGEQKYYVRLRSSNGAKLLVSEADGYDNKSNATRLAKAVNTSACLGRLQIRILDEAGKVERIIEPTGETDERV